MYAGEEKKSFSEYLNEKWTNIEEKLSLFVSIAMISKINIYLKTYKRIVSLLVSASIRYTIDMILTVK